MNGDGFADVIIGAEHASFDADNAGSAFVVFGHGGLFSPSISVDQLDGFNGFRIDGENVKITQEYRWVLRTLMGTALTI